LRHDYLAASCALLKLSNSLEISRMQNDQEAVAHIQKFEAQAAQVRATMRAAYEAHRLTHWPPDHQ
jgi:hypothetical protein